MTKQYRWPDGEVSTLGEMLELGSSAFLYVDEFEAPEADPAEADPAEAEEAMSFFICPLHGAGCEAWA